MDADLLDEVGAMSVLWDCFNEASQPDYDYASAYRRTSARFDETANDADRFHTVEGKRRYQNMRVSVGVFLDSLREELNL
jgi:uncharacterized protein